MNERERDDLEQKLRTAKKDLENNQKQFQEGECSVGVSLRIGYKQ